MRVFVDHTQDEYVVRAISAKTIATSRVVVKRAIGGTFHGLSATYLPLCGLGREFRCKPSRDENNPGTGSQARRLKISPKRGERAQAHAAYQRLGPAPMIFAIGGKQRHRTAFKALLESSALQLNQIAAGVWK
jgi:hypothetical protein